MGSLKWGAIKGQIEANVFHVGPSPHERSRIRRFMKLTKRELIEKAKPYGDELGMLAMSKIDLAMLIVEGQDYELERAIPFDADAEAASIRKARRASRRRVA